MEELESSMQSARRTKHEKKSLKKQRKASHTLLRHEGISTTTQPSRNLLVSNGGLGNGVRREDLWAALTQAGELEALLMPPQKPYAFVTYRSEEGAERAQRLLNAHTLACGDGCVTLYLSFIHSVPREPEVCLSLPEGLMVVEDFVSPEEELQLLEAVDWSSTDHDVGVEKSLKHRRVKHFGYEFLYSINNVDKERPLAAGIPEVCIPVLQRCVQRGLTDAMPDQLTVNEYQAGQGIPPHVDTHSAFDGTIQSLSLGSKAVMEFRHPDGRVVPVLLPGRSLLVMKGESRYLWSHGITPRKFDMVPSSYPQCPAASRPCAHSDLTLNKRETRTSFTFRKIRRGPCICDFPSACDSQQRPSPPSLPASSQDASRLEEEFVHRVYDSIAAHFSSTRHSPWPGVCHFLSSLTAGSILADVGCGNGKYLAVNQEVTSLGCDRSGALLDLCALKGHQVFVSDALCVPLRTSSCDACLSIAVIHHFSTRERRLAALRELLRLLRPGGQALVYVWAFEQEFNQQRSKYLREQTDAESPDTPTNPDTESPDTLTNPDTESPDTLTNPDTESPDTLTSPDSESPGVPTIPNPGGPDGPKHAGGSLTVHTNRTAFRSQDLLVPWHLKGVKSHREDAPLPLSPRVFHRYYHVFQQGELESLCSQLSNASVTSSFYEQGNWCVVLQKERE